MHRFYLPPEHARDDELTLRGAEAHHALHVLRVRRGERVMVLNGNGLERLCEVAEIQRDELRLRAIERRVVPPLPYELTLIQAVPKGKLFEAIIQKATELGAFRVVPLLSERVVVHLDAPEARAKAAKWQGVAIEAIKQCGSAWLPKVEVPGTIEQILAQGLKPDLALVGSLQPEARHPRTYLREFERAQGRRPATVCVWIGPEGDFTPGELQAIQSSGAHPITLGRLVLRTETAAAYCLSFLNYELQAPAD